MFEVYYKWEMNVGLGRLNRFMPESGYCNIYHIDSGIFHHTMIGFD